MSWRVPTEEERAQHQAKLPEGSVDEDGQRCDFCSQAEPAVCWYGCEEFVMEVVAFGFLAASFLSGSRFYACRHCSALVDDGAFATLRTLCMPGAHDLHEGFRARRTGEKTMLGENA